VISVYKSDKNQVASPMPPLLEAQAEYELQNHTGYKSLFMKWTEYSYARETDNVRGLEL